MFALTKSTNMLRFSLSRSLNSIPSTSKSITTSARTKISEEIPAPRTRLAPTAQEDLDKWYANNAKYNRPLAPHLTVYSWSIPMTMSAFYRMLSVPMSFMFLLFPVVWIGLQYRDNVKNAAKKLNDTASRARNAGPVMMSVWLTLKASILVPIVYHIVNGCRHLVWDQKAWGIRHLKQVYASGNFVMLLTAVLSAALLAFHMSDAEESAEETEA